MAGAFTQVPAHYTGLAGGSLVEVAITLAWAPMRAAEAAAGHAASVAEERQQAVAPAAGSSASGEETGPAPKRSRRR